MSVRPTRIRRERHPLLRRLRIAMPRPSHPVSLQMESTMKSLRHAGRERSASSTAPCSRPDVEHLTANRPIAHHGSHAPAPAREDSQC